MARISGTGYKWLYGSKRSKVSKMLQKEGADVEKIQRFFNELDKKKRTQSGKSAPLAIGAFEDRVAEILEDKKITSLADVKKQAPKYAKKIKVEVRYKKNVIQLLLDKKQVVGVV